MQKRATLAVKLAGEAMATRYRLDVSPHSHQKTVDTLAKQRTQAGIGAENVHADGGKAHGNINNSSEC